MNVLSMRFLKIYLLLSSVVLANFLVAQNYQAIHGSPYAGSLGSAANPASITNVPYSWDITPFSVQVKQATNAYIIQKYSLLSSPGNVEIASNNGTKARYVFANQDLHLLNTRINLNARSAIAFGVNVRTYIYATSKTTNWQDTFNLTNFLESNTSNQPFSAQTTGSSWVELYGSYARTILDDGDRRLNAGITVKVSRGLAGGYARTQGLSYTGAVGSAGYLLGAGSLQYGYSNNFDFIDSSKTFKANRKAFLERTYSNIGADVGFEYMLMDGESDEESGGLGYRTKIGVSLMDIGYNKFRYGKESRSFIAGKTGIADTLLEDKFSNIGSVHDFNDSMATIASSTATLGGEFFIYQPTRLVVNIDQHITQNFFINAELTIPVLPIFSKSTLIIRDMNLLAVTPRWEKKSLGFYLPVVVNTKSQFWVGGAFKAGPVLLGTHNLANLFSKNKTQNGGAYLALTIRPGKKYDRDAGSSEGGERLSRKQRRNLDCPSF